MIPGGILILKVNNQRKIKKDIDIKEMKMVIRNKTNEQLNQYSIYFNKVKKDIYLMSYKPILIVPGDPDSIFFEIFLKL